MPGPWLTACIYGTRDERAESDLSWCEQGTDARVAFDMECAREEFPTVALQEMPGPPQDDLPSLPVPVEEWESQNFNFYEMDWRLDWLAERDFGPFAVDVSGEPGELARAAGEILTRCQRWMGRRNEASS